MPPVSARPPAKGKPTKTTKKLKPLGTKKKTDLVMQPGMIGKWMKEMKNNMNVGASTKVAVAAALERLVLEAVCTVKEQKVGAAEITKVLSSDNFRISAPQHEIITVSPPTTLLCKGRVARMMREHAWEKRISSTATATLMHTTESLIHSLFVAANKVNPKRRTLKPIDVIVAGHLTNNPLYK
eukprot:TRINITY_DN13739_c2_g1_i1.p1 TRINITY_DN13739_c2_g1~~TRINITY_DN13739_c2_g1_i1.p1  ORF type:complete len:213 (+),score=42.35 TRINITY_DN13739_c2_g1_i1:91-639(+)